MAFRVLFNARFYYPVFTVLFLDFGLSLEQFAILNAVWAASIVLIEVPTGALADCIGRRTMIRIAAALMTAEILVLVLLPIGNNLVVFWGFFINRILSGAAEAFCSGADEALAYDSLKVRGLESKWPEVLKRLMKIQSVAFVIALLVGSMVYDAALVNKVISFSGLTVSQETCMRLPLVLMLFSCIGAIVCSFRMEDVELAPAGSFIQMLKGGILNIRDSAAWIWNSQIALMLISAGMIFDCTVRLILTLNSEYYRIINYPTWSFGILGALLSLFGFFIPSISAKLVKHKSKAFNYSLSFVLCFAGIYLFSLCIPYWGLTAVALIYITMYNLGFMLSHYLNEIARSEIRATILSFKSLAFNLAYGLIGLLYSWASASIDSEDKRQVFISSLGYIPWFFLTLCLIYLIVFRKHIK